MADSATLIQRNFSPDGITQTVDVLANKTAGPGATGPALAGYYIQTVQGIQVSQSEAQVQTTLNGMVASIIAGISANETPLTDDELGNYQNIIDLQTTQQWLDTLKTDLDKIQVASGIPNATQGLKQAFSDDNKTVYDGLANNLRNELIRATINQMLGNQADEIRALRILLKRAKRVGNTSSFSSLAKS